MRNKIKSLLGTLLCAVGLSGAIVAHAENVLIVAGTTGLAQTAATTISGELTGLGHTVTVVNTGVPGSLAGYTRIYDTRYDNSPAFNASEQSQYLGFLNASPGNTVILLGENAGFASRNNAIASFIGVAGGGSVGSISTSTSAESLGAFTSPNPISSVTFAACGRTSSPGNGLLAASEASGGCVLLYNGGTLLNAWTGALAVVYDINFAATAPTGGSAANEIAFRQNLEAFVATVPSVPRYPTPVTPPIPNTNGPLPPVVGIGTQPTVLDMTAGQGPTMATCLLNTVKGALGSDAVYVGQNANGSVRITQGGRIVSFYPLNASASSTNVGISLGSTNAQNVGTSCGSFNIVPAVYNVTDFGAFLNGLGLVAQIDALGVITVNAGGTIYVIRPDYFVTPGTSSTTPSLRLGADGLYRFTDSAGNVQIMRGAFLDTAGLATQDQFALGILGSTVIQADGTALFSSLLGAQSVLTPDLTFSSVTPPDGSSLWWQDVPGHFFFRSSPFTLVQGFSVKAK